MTLATRSLAFPTAILAVVFLPAQPRLLQSGERDEPLFQPSDRCLACHNGVSSASGEDISIGFDWRTTLMANSSRDPYWQAAVRREVIDHPSARAAIENECAKCHMPMAQFLSRLSKRDGQVFAHLDPRSEEPVDRLAADGVSCALCHQIAPDKLGTRESLVGGFVIDATKEGARPAYGPFEVDAGRANVMRSATGFRPTEARHIRQSELCATCHTLYTHSLGPKGEVIGELPEQVPYQEWLHSDFREAQSCQDCHMPVVPEAVPVSAVLGQPREGVSRHLFLGGNFFLQRILNRYREELGVAALPQEMDAAARRTIAHLQSEAARVSVRSLELRDGRLEAEVLVENLAGHKLPTAYPSRRVWLHVVVRDGGKRTVFESGLLNPDGSIAGNDNDAEAGRYEPHHASITAADQVQIYESIMGDPSGAPTTGLLRAVRYLKDNRVTPRGFDKRTAGKDIAVTGAAMEDEDFTAGRDRVRYSVEVGGTQGPFQVEAELWYQPVSYRWASNLRPYDAPEPRRFVGYYDSMASSSGVILARASAGIEKSGPPRE